MKIPKKVQALRRRHRAVWVTAICIAVLIGAVGSYLIRLSDAATSGGTGGPQTNETNLSFTADGVTSKYHRYAAGLDWTKSVGMIIYADGAGESGLMSPSSNFLLAGADGLINVAKRNNMVLVTPIVPGGKCDDDSESCWNGTSSGISAAQKVAWAEALVKHIHSQYPIELDRVAMGGYSSGAEFATQYWVPSGAAQRTMTDGVIVAISCGGSPRNSDEPLNTEVTYTSAFKAAVHLNWNIGDKDTVCPWTEGWSAKGGYDHYTGKGFQTTMDLLPGVTHSRSGQFGKIMEAQIQEHVAPAIGPVTPPGPPPTNPPPPGPNPAPAKGDLNGDGKVNISDLSVLLSNWGKSGVPADMNGDGRVNITDLSILLSNWG